MLFESLELGKMALKNRVVMAPMTRSRATGNIPNDLMAEYYGQRATAGLIITEGTSPSPDGLGYARIPGLYSQEQAQGWKKVTDAVHSKGGRIFVQLMHTGRIAHPANLPAGARVVAPSALLAPGEMFTDSQGMQPHAMPHELSHEEIEKVIEEYVHASELAVNVAGFDGVELHGANGYLIEQFLNPKSNTRTDQWGGSASNRNRFAVEVSKRVAKKIGADRLGIRMSPYGANGGLGEFEGVDAQFVDLAKQLSTVGLVYLHFVDHEALGAPAVPKSLKKSVREAFKGKYILSGGYDAKRAQHDLKEKYGDLVAFGRPFLSNPTLVEKLKANAQLTAPDSATFYTPGAKGYTDFA